MNRLAYTIRSLASFCCQFSARTFAKGSFAKGTFAVGIFAVSLSLNAEKLTAVEDTNRITISDADVPHAARSLLSNRCFACHGPDAAERQGGFRLDKLESFTAAADSSLVPVIPHQPSESELMRRVTTVDTAECMPPPDFGAHLTADEVELLERWISLGAELPQHWSFVPPVRPSLPDAQLPAQDALAHDWSQHPVDRFVLAQQLVHGFHPSPEATRAELLRRLSLDLIGLPPTPDEVTAFESDTSLGAYERQVDRLLASPAFGEHWARKWLDLARYADSAGYADDPERTIWAYRDWVIRALNADMPLDQFTVEQIAGDLLPDATEDQLIATAFHRNTLTNNEGGTNDEEFRNVAIVDRVNTTMAVWMGVTMGCAQCHTHKYDPLTQDEYFQLFAIFNQSQDADRRDESPFIELFTDDQQQSKAEWQRRLHQIEEELKTPNETSRAEFSEWLAKFKVPEWQPTTASAIVISHTDGSETRDLAGQTIQVKFDQIPVEANYTLSIPLPPGSSEVSESINAISLDTIPTQDLPGGGVGYGGGNFVITGISAWLEPLEELKRTQARYLRVSLDGASKMVSLAEVQVFENGHNIAVHGQATQSSTDFGGDAARAIDGNTDGDYSKNSTTHTEVTDNPWWELDLGKTCGVDSFTLWNRTDNNLQGRLNGASVTLLDENRSVVFSYRVEEAPQLQREVVVVPKELLGLGHAFADYEQPGFPAKAVLDADPSSGWAVGGQHAQPHRLTLLLDQPLVVDVPRILKLEIQHHSPHAQHLLGSFAISTVTGSTGTPSSAIGNNVSQWVRLPPQLQQVVKSVGGSGGGETQELQTFYHRELASSTAELRNESVRLQQQLSELKPATNVPIMRDLAHDQARKTFVQLRGNYKALGSEVAAGTPAVFHPLDSVEDGIDRLDLASWLVDRRNPLTARVFVNRLWESLFGLGIVRTSEEFGSQGDAPTHPELLDWLACEAMDCGWDTKLVLRLLVTSRTYRQTSRVSRELLDADKENVWLARGPRVRLSAEMIRDQALVIAGMLSNRLHGPPVRPPQPRLGLSAAFGSNTDWSTSEGEDRYRRGIYTTWRRSNPYPSMATFDAPSREVCTLRRDSTNTPLQALVTLNDPAFVEAAQALSRRVLQHDPESRGADQRTQLGRAFSLCTSRLPSAEETEALESLLEEARLQLSRDADAAMQLATDPIGPLPNGADAVELAAWTTVCNVLLNLDEVLMKR